MSAPAPLAFPGSRPLAGWWRQLADRQPEIMWIGHLLLHHLEALVERTEQRRVEPIDLLVMKVLVMFPGGTLDRLDQSLHLGPQLLTQTLRGLAKDGLIQQQGTGWNMTPVGRQAIMRGEYPRNVQERRMFSFRAAEPPARAARFLRLNRPATQPWQPGADWSFDPQILQAAVGQPTEWKQANGFPLDVEKVLPQKPATPAMQAWQRVILDRPERLLIVLLQTATEGRDHLLGFGVRQENWTLMTSEPVLSLGAEWREVFAELAEPPLESECQDAWKQWCQTNGLAEVAGEGSALVPQGHLLPVTCSPRLLERIRAARSATLRDDGWLLIGSGRIRRAALLKIVEGAVPSS